MNMRFYVIPVLGHPYRKSITACANPSILFPFNSIAFASLQMRTSAREAAPRVCSNTLFFTCTRSVTSPRRKADANYLRCNCTTEPECFEATASE